MGTHYQTENKYVEEIIEKYADMVYRLALSRTRDIDSSEEVFQEVFYRLSKNVPDFQNEEHKKAWLIKVTINCSKTLLTNKWKKQAGELPENIPAEEHEIQEVYDAVLKLPKKYRTVIHLFYYEDLPVKDIANILNSNENTVKTWLSRAREKLKTVLKGEFDYEQ